MRICASPQQSSLIGSNGVASGGLAVARQSSVNEDAKVTAAQPLLAAILRCAYTSALGLRKNTVSGIWRAPARCTLSRYLLGANSLKQLSRWTLAFSALMPMALHAASVESMPSSKVLNRMDGIRSLRLASIPGNMPTYYSPEAAARAKYLQGLLGGEIAYYSGLFHVSLSPVTLAVLNTEQWSTVAGGGPYGMPSVDGTNPAVFVMPANWNEVKWMAVPKPEEVPPVMLRKALVNGKKWDQVKFEGCDGIGTHEIGHSIIHQLGIYPQAKWFNEFLASYVGYAYLKARAPAQALSNEIFWTAGLAKSPHPITRLDDFETKYDEIQQKYPGNYGWYQLALDQRVIEIYRQRGVDYLQVIRREFPSTASKLSGAQLLDKLEAITPGWKVWAVDVETGNIRPALMTESGHR